MSRPVNISELGLPLSSSHTLHVVLKRRRKELKEEERCKGRGQERGAQREEVEEDKSTEVTKGNSSPWGPGRGASVGCGSEGEHLDYFLGRIHKVLFV